MFTFQREKSLIANIRGISHINHLITANEVRLRKNKYSCKILQFINWTIFVAISTEMFLQMLSEHSFGQKEKKETNAGGELNK